MRSSFTQDFLERAIFRPDVLEMRFAAARRQSNQLRPRNFLAMMLVYCFENCETIPADFGRRRTWTPADLGPIAHEKPFTTGCSLVERGAPRIRPNKRMLPPRLATLSFICLASSRSNDRRVAAHQCLFDLCLAAAAFGFAWIARPRTATCVSPLSSLPPSSAGLLPRLS